jgi:phage FluMu protein Com
MQVLCPKCGKLLAGNDLNVVTDIARCPSCDEVFALSTLVQASASGPVDLDDPPRGTWYRGEFNGFVVGATTRNPIAFFLVPFMCVWSGFSIGGIYGTQIVRGQFDLHQSLFGIPFVLGTLLFGSIALMAVCGKVVVRVSDSEGVVFTGIGPLGWRRPFNSLEVATVSIEPHSSGNNQQAMTIVLNGPHKLRFGSGLTEARRNFIANVLRLELVKGHGKISRQSGPSLL